MSTSKSTEALSPRTDAYQLTPRSDSSTEGGNPSTAKEVLKISTAGSSHAASPRTSSSSAQEGSGSQGQVSEELKDNTTTTGSSMNYSASIASSSTKAKSLGEVEEPSLVEEQVEEEVGEEMEEEVGEEVEKEDKSTPLNDDKFLAQNLDTVLDGFEIFDPYEREEIRKSLEEERERNEEFEAVGKVADVAQSGLKRLQRVVKEKDDLIVALQEAVASAYKDAVAQQERDQKGLEQLHKTFLTRKGLTALEIKDSLHVNDNLTLFHPPPSCMWNQ